MGLELERTPLGMACPSCGVTSVDPFCPGCGLSLLDLHPDFWPALRSRLEFKPALELTVRLAAPEHSARYIAFDKNNRRYEVFVVEQGDPHGVLSHRSELIEKLGDRGLPAQESIVQGKWLCEATCQEGLTSLSEGLTDLFIHGQSMNPVDVCERWIWPLARYIAELHQQGNFVGAWNYSEILIDEEGRLKFRLPPQLRQSGQPWPLERRVTYSGLSAPELYGRCGGDVDERADVFFLGALLHCFLGRVVPAPEAGLSSDRLPPAVVFADDLPPDLTAVCRRAASPLPWRRYANGVEFLAVFEHALELARERATVQKMHLALDIGHELHIGLLKGQFAPVNQDDMFLAWHEPSAIGLFLISDGVSISHYGSGDQASACVRRQASRLWMELLNGRFAPEGQADMQRPWLPESDEERRQLLIDMLNHANEEIAEIVNTRIPVFSGPPEGVMAATAIAALVEGNRVTLVSIGDSRIYLMREGQMVTLMADHDLATQLIRMGRSITASKSAPSTSALVRCVGEFEKSDNHLVPVALRPDLRELNMLPGDVLVLCSDGIPDYAGIDEEDAEIRMRRAVETACGAPWAAFELMVLANRGGGGDNISCIVLSFGEPLRELA